MFITPKMMKVMQLNKQYFDSFSQIICSGKDKTVVSTVNPYFFLSTLAV